MSAHTQQIRFPRQLPKVAGQYQRAIQDYDKAIRLNPKYADAYNNRGAAYSGLGQYQRAMQDYDKAIQMWAPKASYYNNRSVAYRKMGKDAEADADKDEACLRDTRYC